MPCDFARSPARKSKGATPTAQGLRDTLTEAHLRDTARGSRGRRLYDYAVNAPFERHSQPAVRTPDTRGVGEGR